VAGVAQRALASSGNRTLLARDAYTYLHVVLVAAILLAAVGDELVIAHPTEALPDPELLVLVAGPALYLLAHVAMRLRMNGTISARRLGGAVACVLIGLLAGGAPALVVAGLLFAVLVAVIVADQVLAARRARVAAV
jgi:low temperature requirement protein LtrA